MNDVVLILIILGIAPYVIYILKMVLSLSEKTQKMPRKEYVRKTIKLIVE